MNWKAVCVAMLVCLLIVETLANSNCTDNFQCFDIEYSQCVNDGLTTASGAQLVQVIVQARRGLPVDTDDFSQLLTELVCHHLNRSTPPPLCWHTSVSNVSTSPSECNCTSAQITVLEMTEGDGFQPALSRESFLQLLQSSHSFFGLAGYTLTIVQGASDDRSTGVDLYDVPLVSWIIVALGVVSSLTLLTKPVWWDRIIVKCRQRCGR